MDKRESSEGKVWSENKDYETNKIRDYENSKSKDYESGKRKENESSKSGLFNQSKTYDKNIVYTYSMKSEARKNETNSGNKKSKIKIFFGRNELNATSEKKQNRLSLIWKKVRKTIDETRKNISNWFRNRIKMEQEEVKEKSKELSFYEILNGVERILYKSKLTSLIMSFIEYIFIIYLLVLYTYVLIPAHNVIGFEVFLYLPLVLGSLCLIKKKFIITLLGLISIIIERIYVLKRYYDYMNMLGSRLIITFWLLVLETVLLTYILIKLVVLWYHSQEGINLRYRIAKILLLSVEKPEESPSNSEERMILVSLDESGARKETNEEGMTLDEEVIKQIKNNIDSDLVATIERENGEELKGKSE